ncbi:MAG TPA: pentapeptide repeat-containing protein [Puia sp.]|nr:pentapeptide repeat-containing protein [Puia sp.]
MEPTKIRNAKTQLDVSESVIDGSKFLKVMLKDCLFRDVMMAGTRYDPKAKMRPLKFEDCNLEGSLIKDSNLASSAIKDCNLSGSVIENCNLTGADLKNCNITGLKIDGVDVSALLDEYRKGGGR